jgi:hypothetical protein
MRVFTGIEGKKGEALASFKIEFLSENGNSRTRVRSLCLFHLIIDNIFHFERETERSELKKRVKKEQEREKEEEEEK